jgi:hypothetical protein
MTSLRWRLRLMLGYDKEDLDIMMESLSDAISAIDTKTPIAWRTAGGLITTLTFLQGLREEGWQ